MLNYITTKRDARFEWRFYIEPNDNVEGRIIYKGHKLGVGNDVLSNMIEYKQERTTNRIYLMDYENQGRWFVTNDGGLIETLSESYDTLQRIAQEKFGKFRKVVISVV
jgi:hypothetical protein